MNGLNLLPRIARLRVRGSDLDGTIRPADFTHPLLSAELADEYLDMFSTLGLSHGTVYNHRKALLSLLTSLPPSLKKTISLGAEGGEDLAESFYMWERDLGTKYKATSHLPTEYPTVIRRLFRQRVASGRQVSSRVCAWATGQNLHSGGVDRPLDEFSNRERLVIRDGCRSRIRGLEQRLDRGRSLLRIGRDPRVHGWSGLPNLLWALHNLARDEEPSILKALSDAFSTLTNAEQEELGGPYDRGRGASHHIVRKLSSMLYPADLDLAAFRTLLQLETGAAPEEISAIKPGDLERHDGSFQVPLRKDRGRRTRHIRLKLSGQDTNTRSGWRGGDLVQGLLTATALVRELPGDDPDSIFLIACRRGSTINPRQEHFSNRTFSRMIHELGAEISLPHDPRRLRKTVKSARAAILRSAATAAGDDHSIAVYQRHYAQSTTVHILAANAITAAQTQVFERATTGPKFIRTTALEALNMPLPTEIKSAAEAELAQSVTDSQLGVGQCSDPYTSPYGDEGRLCQVRPAMCFACPNAIIFSDHLPRLLSYRKILESHQLEMAPTVFAATHGQQLQNLDRILAEFTPEEIHKAQTSLTVLSTAVHIPLSQRGTHL